MGYLSQLSRRLWLECCHPFKIPFAGLMLFDGATRLAVVVGGVVVVVVVVVVGRRVVVVVVGLSVVVVLVVVVVVLVPYVVGRVVAVVVVVVGRGVVVAVVVVRLVVVRLVVVCRGVVVVVVVVVGASVVVVVVGAFVLFLNFDASSFTQPLNPCFFPCLKSSLWPSPWSSSGFFFRKAASLSLSFSFSVFCPSETSKRETKTNKKRKPAQ